MSKLALVTKNFLALGGGEAIGRLIAFGAMVFAGRTLGVEGFGVIGFSMALMLYGAALADFGVETIGTQKVAAQRDDAVRFASAVLSIRLLFGLALAAAVAGLAYGLLPRTDGTVLAIHAAAILPLAASTKWVHLGLESTRPIGLARIIGDLVMAGLVLGFVRGPDDLLVLPAALVAAEFVVSGVLYFALARRDARPRLTFDFATVRPVIKQALPIVGHSMLGLLIYNADTIMLRYYEGERSVGFYNAAYQLISFLLNLGVAYGFSLLPTLTRAGAGSDEERTLYQNSLVLVTAATIPIALGGWFYATPIITTFFSDLYTTSGIALGVLIFSIPFSLIRNVGIAALMARERPDQMFKTTVYAAILNVVLNVIMIPRYGIAGAAIATVATEGLRTILAIVFVRAEGLRMPPLWRHWRGVVSGAVMVGALYGLNTTNVFIGVPLGALAFVVGLVLTGGIRFEGGRPAVRL